MKIGATSKKTIKDHPNSVDSIIHRAEAGKNLNLNANPVATTVISNQTSQAYSLNQPMPSPYTENNNDYNSMPPPYNNNFTNPPPIGFNPSTQQFNPNTQNIY
jgi:hypothetical protein